MPHRRGSFHEDWNDLLIRFAHRGTPAAIEDQLRESRPKRKSRRCAAFHVNQGLFERAEN